MMNYLVQNRNVDLRSLRLLAENDTDHNIAYKNRTGQNCLHKYAQNQREVRVDVLEFLIDELGADLNLTDRFGYNTLEFMI